MNRIEANGQNEIDNQNVGIADDHTVGDRASHARSSPCVIIPL